MARPDSPDGSDRACPTLNISLRDCRCPATTISPNARTRLSMATILSSDAALPDGLLVGAGVVEGVVSPLAVVLVEVEEVEEVELDVEDDDELVELDVQGAGSVDEVEADVVLVHGAGSVDEELDWSLPSSLPLPLSLLLLLLLPLLSGPEGASSLNHQLH
ncbi:hypothetical protein CALCODRAFT_379997 [Calocera cornea HHB12733]|uniref:Uncharacterized protein n=1 Tax=Calocera cornea HHB12733 TaxID=1353952 RepID=A0A165ECB3_9BASI|nr:hypothetical protein CALCODRAFT_379997 [Calocera cornea HHB12733]